MPSRRSATSRTTIPRSRRASHGPRFASWSSSVITISSPGFISRARAWLNEKFSVVMLAPKEISRQEGAPRNAATASRAPWITSSDSLEVTNAPCVLALQVR